MSRDKTIAVLGASSNRSKYGNKCVRAYADEGWTVYPVNLSQATIEGLDAFPSLADVPGDLDRVSVYLPPAVTASLLPEIAARGSREVWFNPGSADSRVLAQARQLGINAIDACSIVDIGRSPSQYP